MSPSQLWGRGRRCATEGAPEATGDDAAPSGVGWTQGLLCRRSRDTLSVLVRRMQMQITLRKANIGHKCGPRQVPRTTRSMGPPASARSLIEDGYCR